jgi:UDP-N-acetylmuramoyl-tripeptide--D-alanyl-D-alanine ligase
MAELGDESPAMHERVGERAARTGVAVLLAGGRYAAELETGARRGGLSAERIVRFAANDDAARWLHEHLRQDDVVLLKGSRIYKLEEIVERLRS